MIITNKPATDLEFLNRLVIEKPKVCYINSNGDTLLLTDKEALQERVQFYACHELCYLCTRIGKFSIWQHVISLPGTHQNIPLCTECHEWHSQASEQEIESILL